MNWKRFTILICSIAGVVGIIKLAEACGGGNDHVYYEEKSFFLSSVNNKPIFIPFYYTSNNGNDDIEEMQSISNIKNDVNKKSWKKYTVNAVPDADIDSFVYRYKAADVHNIYEHIRKGYTLKVPAVVASNKFTQWLISHKDHEAALYLAFAKACEPYAAAPDYYWNEITHNYESKKRDSAAMQELVHEGIKRVISINNSELKLRYAYQTMRMALYSGEYTQTQMLFHTLVAPSRHFLYYRCLSLRAGALFKTNKKAEAAYLYSHVFDSSDELKTEAHISFSWATNGDLKKVLPLCRSNHQKAVLHLMKGMYDFDGDTKTMFDALKNAYALDPKTIGIDVLMTRIINKMEYHLIQEILKPDPKNKDLYSQLIAFAQQAATDGKSGTPSYWRLAASYLYLAGGDGQNCKKQLDLAANNMTTKESVVHNTITALYHIRKSGKITATTEANILPHLKKMEMRNRNVNLNNNDYNYMMVNLLSKAYMQQQDTIKAVFCLSKYFSGIRTHINYGVYSPYYFEGWDIIENMSIPQLQKTENFLIRSSKTLFEQWLTQKTAVTTGILHELAGTKYIRLHQFTKAAVMLQKVPDSLLRMWVLPDVLVSHISDRSDWNKSDSGVLYNKLTVARRMAGLQARLDENPKDARAAYQYANGLYSISFYGKAAHAHTYFRGTSEPRAYYQSEERKESSYEDLQYFGLGEAEHYYKVAFENSTDPEVKARCLFMAAKCWQKNCPIDDSVDYYNTNQNSYYVNSLNNPYFARLRKGYSNTAFFKNASDNCSYLRDYIRKR